jgi:hypothetical protein
MSGLILAIIIGGQSEIFLFIIDYSSRVCVTSQIAMSIDFNMSSTDEEIHILEEDILDVNLLITLVEERPISWDKTRVAFRGVSGYNCPGRQFLGAPKLCGRKFAHL